MKKLLVICLCVVLGGVSFASWAAEVTPVQSVKKFIRVKAGPEISTETIANLKKGETLEVVRGYGYWYQVTLPSGETGYVQKQRVRLLGEDVVVEADVQQEEAQAVAAEIKNELLQPGMIVLWQKANTELPVGWVVCNGENGTPDLSSSAPEGLSYIMRQLP